KVQHDVNPEVDSLLGMYQLGAVRRLDFGTGGGVAITPQGLQFVSLARLYETWVRFLYAVVEMENALLNDYSIGEEQVTHDETRGQPRRSHYRAQLLLQTHERFLCDYLAKICGTPLDELWALTSGLCSNRQDYRWVREQVGEIESSPAAQSACSLGSQALASLSAIPESDLPALEKLTEDLRNADREFLNQFKLGLRQGLQVFETYERQTLSQGHSALLEAAQALPGILQAYYQRLGA
ncbi:MAG: hypothetical protein R6W69_16885, partial [Anaerolineales bacterium]